MAITTLPVTYADGNILTASDLNQNFNALNTATIPVASGGTGLTSGTSGGVLYFSSTTAIGTSGALTQYGVVYGGGAGAAPLATAAGAANTLLHGNGAAAPTFSAVVEADITLANNTTNNVSATKHGFAPILPNDANQYLNGIGGYSVPASGLSAASQAQMEAGSSNTVAVTPGVAQYHPSTVKAWCNNAHGGTTINASYNVSSVTRNGAGDYTITFTTAFSSANYAAYGSAQKTDDTPFLHIKDYLAGSVRYRTFSTAFVVADFTSASVACNGDQP